MTAVYVLVALVLAGLLLPAVAGPRVLRSAAPVLMRMPRVAVGLLSSAVVFWTLAALSVGPLVAWVVTGPDLLPADAAAVCSRCLAAADPFGLDRIDTAVPVALLLVIPIAASVAHAVRVALEARRRRSTTLRTAALYRHRGVPARIHGHAVRLIDDAHPFALALPRRHGGIMVSTAAVELLSDEELGAVLAHEAAHLRQRHHAVSALVSTLTTGLRWVPLFAAVEDALGHYLEIAADDAARRTAGTTALAGALLTLGRYGRHRDHSGEELAGALHALGPDRIRHLVQPASGSRGVAAAVATAFCLTSLAMLAAAVHVPYVMAVITGCY